MKTFGRVAWLVAGYVLLALASGASPQTSRSSVALGQTVNTHKCVSDITNLTVAWNATDLVLNRKNAQASTGTLMIDAAYDYEGGITENEEPRESINQVNFFPIMSVIVLADKVKGTIAINLGNDESEQFILNGIQKLPDLAGQSYTFTGAQLMDLIIQRASENEFVTSIPANQFKTTLSMEYFMSSSCQEGAAGAICAHDSADVKANLMLKKGNGSVSGTDPAPGFSQN